MARSQARIKVAIWEDADFLRLSSGAQRLYMLVLSQPDLTMCGVLPWSAKRLATLAHDTTAALITKWARELHEARFVVLDLTTDELWVRTLVTGDGVLDSPNTVLAMSNAFGAIHSQVIREGLLEGLGEGFMEGLPNRFKKPLPEGFMDRLAKPFREGLSRAGAGVPPASCLLPPANPSSSESDTREPVENPEEEEDSRIEKAAVIAARRRLARRSGPPIAHPEAWLAQTANGILTSHYADLTQTADVSNLDPERLADLLDPPSNGHTDPHESTAAAQRAMAERAANPCPTCAGMDVIEALEGVVPCPDCNQRVSVS